MILRLQEQGYNTVTRLAGRAFRSVSDFVMQTAIRVGFRTCLYFQLLFQSSRLKGFLAVSVEELKSAIIC